VFLALFQQHRLAPGEVGVVLVLAASKAQASVVFRYVIGFLQASAVLSREIESVTSEVVRLRNGIEIGVHTASYRTVRGRTIVAAIFDETSFWRDEASAEPDLEIYRAVLPSLATSRGMLISISSPYRRIGLLYQKHRDYFGIDDPDVLVISGPSRAFNPTLDQRIIDQHRAADPEAALAEWDGAFRTDIAAFLSEDVLEAAIDRNRPLELPPRTGVTYRAAIDSSGGRHDSYTLCISHKEDEQVVADVIRGREPPFDPRQVTGEFSALIQEYGFGSKKIREVHGDNYSAEWVAQSWKSAGFRYVRSELPASGLYLEGLPLFMRGAVSIPEHKRLIRELRLLERRTSRTGRDIVDHGRAGHDDYAASLFGSAYITNKPVFVGGAGPIAGAY
jgi:hypothetical protein